MPGTHQGSAKRRLPAKDDLIVYDDARPWDRRMNESEPAWEAFVLYRDAGLERSLAKVAQGLGKSKPLMNGWSAKHHWLQRVTLFDRHNDQLALKVREKEAAEALKRHLTMVTSVQTKLVSQLLERQFDTLTDNELAQTIERMVRLERTLREVDKQRIDVGVTLGGDEDKPVAIKFVVEQIDHEIERREAEYDRRMAARSDGTVARLAPGRQDGVFTPVAGSNGLEVPRAPGAADSANGHVVDLADAGGEVLGED